MFYCFPVPLLPILFQSASYLFTLFLHRFLTQLGLHFSCSFFKPSNFLLLLQYFILKKIFFFKLKKTKTTIFRLRFKICNPNLKLASSLVSFPSALPSKKKKRKAILTTSNLCRLSVDSLFIISFKKWEEKVSVVEILSIPYPWISDQIWFKELRLGYFPFPPPLIPC